MFTVKSIIVTIINHWRNKGALEELLNTILSSATSCSFLYECNRRHQFLAARHYKVELVLTFETLFSAT